MRGTNVTNGARSIRALARLALVGVAAALWAVLTPGVAMALDVHHILPVPGSALAVAPDHLEVMVDEDLQPGRVQMGLSPDTTDVPIALAPPLVDGPLAIQPLPALPVGAYSGGFRILAHDGRIYQGTFHFTVGPGGTAAPPAAAPPAAPPSSNRGGLVAGVAAGLMLPAAGAVVVSRVRRRRTSGARPLSTAGKAGAGRS